MWLLSRGVVCCVRVQKGAIVVGQDGSDSGSSTGGIRGCLHYVHTVEQSCRRLCTVTVKRRLRWLEDGRPSVQDMYGQRRHRESHAVPRCVTIRVHKM